MFPDKHDSKVLNALYKKASDPHAVGFSMTGRETGGNTTVLKYLHLYQRVIQPAYWWRAETGSYLDRYWVLTPKGLKLCQDFSATKKAPD